MNVEHTRGDLDMNFPLFVNFHGSTIGRGFLADIKMCGRVLCTKEADGSISLSGAQPGGIAECGATMDEAHAAFRETLRLLLIDFSTESVSFDSFESKLRQFFDDVDETTNEEWQACVAERRRCENSLSLFGVTHTIPAETNAFLTVTKKATGDLTPDLNQPVTEALLADSGKGEGQAA